MRQRDRCTITVASYNVRKAIGTDRKRDPQRVLDVLHEIDADIIALQEADKRFGGRGAAVPHELIDDHGMYKPVSFGVKHRRVLDRMPGGKRVDALLKINTRNMGWHGNAILVKQHIGVLDCATLELPTFEPRGAVLAELLIGDRPVRVIGMHLDLSGLWRRRQIRAILDAVGTAAAADADDPDGRHQRMAGRGRLPPRPWAAASTSRRPGPSFHSRHPVAALDRIIVDRIFGSMRRACT